MKPLGHMVSEISSTVSRGCCCAAAAADDSVRRCMHRAAGLRSTPRTRQVPRAADAIRVPFLAPVPSRDWRYSCGLSASALALGGCGQTSHPAAAASSDLVLSFQNFHFPTALFLHFMFEDRKSGARSRRRRGGLAEGTPRAALPRHSRRGWAAPAACREPEPAQLNAVIWPPTPLDNNPSLEQLRLFEKLRFLPVGAVWEY